MTYRFADRVKVTASAPGTGTIPTSLPAVVGFQQFSAISGVTNGDIIPYTISDGGANWETGFFTYNSGTGMVRSVSKSSNSNSAVNFTGNVTIWVSPIAAALPLLDSASKLTLPGALSVASGTITGPDTGTWSSTGLTALSLTAANSGQLVFTLNSSNSGGPYARIQTTGTDFAYFGSAKAIIAGGNLNDFAIISTSGNAIDMQAGGSGGVALAAGGIAWTALSDYRAKILQGAFTASGEIIDAVPVYIGAYKDYMERPMPTEPRALFLAHEVQAVVPWAVHGAKDGETMQRLESTDPLVPILWAEVRELRKRLAALES